MVLALDLRENTEVDGSFSFAGYQLVGHGSVTNGFCGKFKTYYGCTDAEAHDKIGFDKKTGVPVNYRGKAYIRRSYCSCDKPSCPICYKYGWATREAGNIEGRLFEASKKFGLVEHIIVTVPPKFYGLDLEALRSKARDILKARGVIGGVMIFHAFRYNKDGRKFWYFGSHFHVLGFILGGYSRCRKCQNSGVKCFRGCGGWRDKNFRATEKDGCVVKIAVNPKTGRADVRQTVGGTAWYQLNHASIKVGVERFQTATWFGVCSYHKLKVTVERRKSLCLICGKELEKLSYRGSKRHLLDCIDSFKGHGKVKVDSLEDLEEDGVKVWVSSSASYSRG